MRIIPAALPRSQYAIALFQAGRFHAAREHWLLQAKSSIEDQSFYIGLAKSSHRAYMNALRLVRQLNMRLRSAA